MVMGIGGVVKGEGRMKGVYGFVEPSLLAEKGAQAVEILLLHAAWVRFLWWRGVEAHAYILPR